MSQNTDPLLVPARLMRPQMPAVYPRKRLFRLMESSLQQASLWVEGPAGCGKTTLVNSYLEDRSLPCLWYRFDQRDTDLGSFFYGLRQAAGIVHPEAAQRLPVLSPEYLLDVPTFSRRFFETFYQCLLQGRAGSGEALFVIVFDDYHNVPAESSLHDLVKLAVDDLPPGMRMVFLSRATVPAALAPLQATRDLLLLEGEQLCLTLEETRGIVSMLTGKRNTSALSQALHEAAQGWVAGLILLLAQIRDDGDESALEIRPLPGAIHDYFLQTVFAGLDEELKGFLLKTAYCPFMTVTMACRLSGDDRAGQILETLHRNNFFTEKRAAGDAIYRYHTLFRDFLLSQAERILEPELRRRLQQESAECLEAAGYDEQAATLYLLLEDWESLSRLVLEKSQTLLRQGRFHVLSSWLEAMPREWRSTHPWLQYWLGYCRLHDDPYEARACFEAAYRQFEQAADCTGQSLAWVAIVETALANWDFVFLIPWVRTMEAMLGEGCELPGPEIEARVTLAMFSALMFLEPWNNRMTPWLRRLEACIRQCPDYGYKLQSSVFLISYYQWQGRTADMVALVGALKPLGREDVQPMARLNWCISEAIASWFVSDWEQCRQAVEQGLEISDCYGARVMEPLLSAQGVYEALSVGDLDTGRGYLERIKAAIDAGNRMNRAHYYYLAAWYDVLRDRKARAVHHLQTALHISREEHTPFPAACSQVELAGLLIEQGDLETAEKHLQEATETAARIHATTLTVKCLLTRALLADRREQVHAASEARREALSLACRHGFSNLPWWLPGSMATHCVKALEDGIEVEYVQGLVRKRGLVPDQPPVHLENWPWELKIYTLGRFAVVRGGETLDFPGKGQRMPLLLLKTLIAMGGRAVPESALNEALWPAAEVESAHSSFATTLSRLRRLLGDPRLLQMRDGHLSLDPCRCWVDAWAYERASGAADKLWRDETVTDGEHFVPSAVHALQLYKGNFLADDSSEEYAIFSARERMREKHLRLVEHLGEWYRNHGREAEAAACYEKGLEVDDLVEDFYRHLMMCYISMGCRAKAVRLYQRCRQVLRSRLGIEPAPATTALYRTLRGEAGSPDS